VLPGCRLSLRRRHGTRRSADDETGLVDRCEGDEPDPPSLMVVGVMPVRIYVLLQSMGMVVRGGSWELLWTERRE
jgi:hypothetical protein